MLNSVTYAESIGRAIPQAEATHLDPIDAVLATPYGFLLFKDRIIDVQRRIEKGWALGEVVIAVVDADAGSHLVVQSQNEHLVAIRDGDVLASVPDLIAILDSERGSPITTEELRYGFRVAVVAMPSDKKWRTPAGIELGGPRHFRYDIDFVPVEQRFGALWMRLGSKAFEPYQAGCPRFEDEDLSGREGVDRPICQSCADRHAAANSDRFELRRLWLSRP